MLATTKNSKPSQTTQVLRLLKANGQATNYELNKICFRFSARIYELRREGHKILTIREKEGLYRFVYKGNVNEGAK